MRYVWISRQNWPTSKPKFPKVVKVRRAVGKFHKTPGRGCDHFTVVHYVGEKRVREYFSDYEVGLTHAGSIAAKLSSGELEV